MRWLNGSERDALGDDVWSMYASTYARIGMHLRGPADLFKYDPWLVFFASGVPVAFVLFRWTGYGLKLGVIGSDGSPTGKQRVIHWLATAFNEPGVYGEVSYSVEQLTGQAPRVCAADAKRVLGKPIKPSRDGIHYRRTISVVGTVEKVMVGRPSRVPASVHPTCGEGEADRLERADAVTFLDEGLTAIGSLYEGFVGERTYSLAEQARRITEDDAIEASAQTAITRQGPSPVARALLDGLLREFGAQRVLDFGCGLSQDWQHYEDAGYEAVGFDPCPEFGADRRPQGSFDLVTILYVINVLPPRSRSDAVADAASYVRKGGRLLIVSRSSHEIEREAATRGWPRAFDGYWSGRGFQKGVSEEAIGRLVRASGLYVEREPAIHGLQNATYTWGIR